MCGRYALSIRASFARHRIREAGLDVDEGLGDDDVRETYNFAPGYRGMVFRANVPPSGARNDADLDHEASQTQNESIAGTTQIGSEDVPEESQTQRDDQPDDSGVDVEQEGSVSHGTDSAGHDKESPYKLQAMQWGLVPFWTKRDPGFGGVIKTINCRDDSLARSGGMWNTMKKTKRCVVVAQGFYEWQKKDGGRTKIPHFVKRKDGELMCFAGLWDCVQYDGSDEKKWTYTIITTDVSKELSFLHNRMPVILNLGSPEMKVWLDKNRTEWTKELQSLLKPYAGELEYYPVNKEVGKVGNNSPDFIVPVNSSENKTNIANFFGNAKSTKGDASQGSVHNEEASSQSQKNSETEDRRETVNVPHSEDNAPLPMPEGAAGKKHTREDERADDQLAKQIKLDDSASPQKLSAGSPTAKNGGRQMRSATSNQTASKERAKISEGSQKITNFFGK